MRRPAPRPLARALDSALSGAEPQTLLARVQAAWAEVAGPVVAAEAAPVGEREGTVTVACGSSVWAQELELMADDLAQRLNDHMGPSRGSRRVERLRFRTAPGDTP